MNKNMNNIHSMIETPNTSRSAGTMLTRARVGLALACAAFMAAVPCLRAETEVSKADKHFILAAAQGGIVEVKLGELAVQKATRADIKAFGKLMTTDHAAINADLKALASQKGIVLPVELDAKHQEMVDKLAGLPNAEFDDAYIKAMTKDHKMDVKEFHAEAAKTEDADIKAFVNKSVPVVEEHLRQITALRK